jgi:hypothetical protein
VQQPAESQRCHPQSAAAAAGKCACWILEALQPALVQQHLALLGQHNSGMRLISAQSKFVVQAHNQSSSTLHSVSKEQHEFAPGGMM